MNWVIVSKNMFGHATVANTLYHRRMVAFIGEDMTAGKSFGQREESGIVRNVAGREQQSRLFLVKLGQGGF